MEKKRGMKRCLTAFMLMLLMTIVMGMGAFAQDRIVDMQPQGNGVYSYTEQDGDYSNVYHRMNVPVTGALVVSGKSMYSFGDSSIGFKVYNSKMQELTSSSYVNANDSEYATYGVKAGTYYIKTNGYRRYTIAASYEKISDKAGAKKAKAKTLKQGKGMSGVVALGEKSSAADWYKFKVKKGKVLNLEISTLGNGYLRYTIYGPSYKKGLRIADQKNESGAYRSIRLGSNKKSKVKAGTYYIKVTKASYDKQASGVYNIKWK